MTHHTIQRRAKLRPLPAYGLVPGGALPPPTTRVYTVWSRFLHETGCIDQAWNFSTGKTDSAIQSVFPKISTRWRVNGDFRPVSDFAQVLASGFLLRFQQVPHSEHILSRKNPNRLRFILAARHSNGVMLCKSKRDDMQRSPSLRPVTTATHKPKDTRTKEVCRASVSQVALFGFPTRILGFCLICTSTFWVTCPFFPVAQTHSTPPTFLEQQKIVATPHPKPKVGRPWVAPRNPRVTLLRL